MDLEASAAEGEGGGGGQGGERDSAALSVSVCGRAAGKQPDVVFSESSCGSLRPDGAPHVSGMVPGLAQLSITQCRPTRPSRPRSGRAQSVGIRNLLSGLASAVVSICERERQATGEPGTLTSSS